MSKSNHSIKPRRVFSKVFITLLFILMIAFIFYQSFQSGDTSSFMSSSFTQTLQSWLDAFGIQVTLQQEWIRIVAHALEFFLLGCITAGAIWIYRNPRMSALFRNIVVFIPLIDEGIQYFIPGRAFQWLDLLIDFAGLLLGMAAIVHWRKNHLKHRVKEIK
jgi:VanZ family protein